MIQQKILKTHKRSITTEYAKMKIQLAMCKNHMGTTVSYLQNRWQALSQKGNELVI
jgi:hypothetical protein